MSQIKRDGSTSKNLRLSRQKKRTQSAWQLPPQSSVEGGSLATNWCEHLKWIEEERVVFWCWLFIQHATSDSIDVEVRDGDNNEILYTHMPINKKPISDSERRTTIRNWFEILEKKTSLADAYKVMKSMQAEWAYIFNKVKGMSWLPKSKVATQWAWGRMSKELYFNKRGVISFYQPLDTIERYHAIVASFDETFPEDYMNLKEVIKYRNYLIHRLHEAYKRTVPTVKKDSRVQISVKISPAAKGKLDRLARERNATQQMLIEQLILSGHLD